MPDDPIRSTLGVVATQVSVAWGGGGAWSVLEQTTRGTWATVATITIVVLAGVIVLLLLFPAGVLHSNPPQCLSTFGHRVPCGRLPILAFRLAEWSLLASAVTAGAVGFVLKPDSQR